MELKSKIIWAHLGLLLCALMWGSTYPLVKYILSDIQPLPEVSYRFIFAALLMAVIIKVKKKPFLKQLDQGIILGLLLWIVYIPQTIGLQYTSAVNAGFIVSMYVVLVPVFSIILLKEKLSRNRLIALGCALRGLWIVSGTHNSIQTGDVLVLVSTVGVALHMLATGYFARKNTNPFTLCFQQYAVVAILASITTLASGEPLGIQKQSTLIILIYLAIFPSFLAFLFQTIAEKYITPVNTALICVMEPLFGVALAYQFGKESIGKNQIIGGFCIITAVLIAELPNKKEKLKHRFHHHFKKHKRL